MGLKTTRLISFLPTCSRNIHTHGPETHRHTCIHDRPPARFSHPTGCYCIFPRRNARAACIPFETHTRTWNSRRRTYIKCVYEVDGMRAGRAPRGEAGGGCHLNKCLISPTSRRPLCIPGNILSVLPRVLARFFFHFPPFSLPLATFFYPSSLSASR